MSYIGNPNLPPTLYLKNPVEVIIRDGILVLGIGGGTGAVGIAAGGTIVAATADAPEVIVLGSSALTFHVVLVDRHGRRLTLAVARGAGARENEQGHDEQSKDVFCEFVPVHGLSHLRFLRDELRCPW